MMAAAIYAVIGLLEQPRRSKMAWLREWRRLIEVFGAQETHLASCNFQSVHQKEFRLLGVNLNIQKLFHPCTRDHSHVKIPGGFTKKSAVYTDALAARIADVLDEELRARNATRNFQTRWVWSRPCPTTLLSIMSGRRRKVGLGRRGLTSTYCRRLLMADCATMQQFIIPTHAFQLGLTLTLRCQPLSKADHHHMPSDLLSAALVPPLLLDAYILDCTSSRPG